MANFYFVPQMGCHLKGFPPRTILSNPKNYMVEGMFTKFYSVSNQFGLQGTEASYLDITTF